MHAYSIHGRSWLPAGAVPLAVILGLCLGVPAVVMIAVSFAKSTFAGIEWVPTLANYRRLLFDGTAMRVLAKSVGTGLFVTAVTLGLAYPMAYWIARRPARRKTLLILLLLLPYWISYVIRTYAWYPLLQANGAVATLLEALGLVAPPGPQLLFTDAAVMLGLVYVYFPFAAVPIFLALDRIPRALLEASGDLGATAWQTFRRVVFPLSLSGTLAGGLLVFILTTGSYVTPKLLGGPSSILFGEIIADQFGGSFNWSFGAALSVAFLVVVALAIAVVSRFVGLRQAFFGQAPAG